MARFLVLLLLAGSPIILQSQQLASAYTDGSFTWNLKSQCNQKGSTGREKPEALLGAVMWTKGDTLFLFGGGTKDLSGGSYTDFKLSNRLWIYDKDTWSFWKGSPGYVSGWGSPNYEGSSTFSYGQQGVTSTANFPGARVSAAYASSPDGTLYMYGGYGLCKTSSGNTVDVIEDLWMFDGTNWTSLMDGISTLTPSHGTMGVPNSSNSPGGRAGAILWYDNGFLYLYGGTLLQNIPYSNNLQPTVAFNDLWQYELASGLWTWIGGSSSGSTGATYSGSAYTYPQDLTEMAHCFDSNGDLYLYGGWTTNGSVQECNTFWKYNGSSWTLLSGDPTNASNPNGSLPGAQSGGQLIEHDGSLYLIGASQSPNSVFRWDGSSWSLFKSCNAPSSGGNLQIAYDKEACPGNVISYASSCSWKGETYLFGGTNVSSGDYSSTLYKFNGQNFAFESSSGLNNYAFQYANSAMISFPGGLNRAAWTYDEQSQSLYLYGGDSYDPGYHSNLWKYQNGDWVWLTGSGASSYTSAVHGTQGVSSANNTPGSRMDAVMWMGSGDTLWLFGGYGYDENGSVGRLSDLYCYVEGEWTWMKGSKFKDDLGSFGTQGQAAASNNPPGLSGMKVWTNPQGEAYIFGGISAASSNAYYNTIWKFNGTNWIWIKGDNTFGSSATYGTKGIPAAGNNPGGSFNFTLAGDANGFYTYGGEIYYSHRSTPHFSNQLWYFDASTEEWTFLFGSTLGASNVPTYDVETKNSNLVNPGYNRGGASWVANGKFYLSSGLIYTGISSHYYTPSNNLWEWDGTYWSWNKGAKDAEGADPNLAVYNSESEFNYDHIPAPRYYPIYWKAGNSLYLAKGLVTASGMNSQNLDDMWAFHPGNFWNGSTWSNGLPNTPQENVQIISSSSPNQDIKAYSLLIDADLSVNVNSYKLILNKDLFAYGNLSGVDELHFEGEQDQYIWGNQCSVSNSVLVSANSTLHTNNKLRLTASSNSSFGQLVNLGTVEDSVEFEFYVSLSSGSNNGRYIHLGSIFENAQLSLIRDQANGIVGLDHSGSNSNKNSIWKWNSNTAGWESPASTDAFEIGKAYAIYAGSTSYGNFLVQNGESGVLSLKGLIPNSSSNTIPLSYNNGQSSSFGFSGGSSVSATEGWNHISNPFPFSVRIKDLIQNSALSNKTIYIWNGSNFSTYNTSLDIYTNNGTVYIAPGQGFYIQMAGSDQGSISELTFDKSSLWTKTSGIKGNFYKNTPVADGLRINLVSPDSLNHNLDDLWLGFHPSATARFDGAFDAWKIMDYSAKTYIIAPDGEHCASTFNPDSTQFVDLGISSNIPNGDTLMLKFNLKDLKSFAIVEIEDLKTGIRQNLQSSSNFLLVQDTAISQRIRLHFKDGLHQSNSSFKKPAFSFYNMDQACFLKSIGAKHYNEELEVRIFSLGGQLIESVEWIPAFKDLEVLSNKAPGLYQVQIYDAQLKEYHSLKILKRP